jgi:hypothetical protein
MDSAAEIGPDQPNPIKDDVFAPKKRGFPPICGVPLVA